MLNNNFAFRLSNYERRMLEELSRRLQRTQSDTIRLLIREAARQVRAENDDGGTKVEAQRAAIVTE